MFDTEKILKEIEGGVQFLQWMGLNRANELNFGDCEVVEISMKRSGSSVLTLWVKQLGSESQKEAWVYFYLKDMIHVSIEGFMHQNVIGGMAIKRVEQINIHASLAGIGAAAAKHHIVLEPCAGAFGSIKATIAKIEFQEIVS